MELLFKRKQTSGGARRVKFKLWGKIELDEDEQALVERYKFDNAVMIAVVQPTLFRNALVVGACVTLVLLPLLASPMGFLSSAGFSMVIGAVAAFWYFHDKRETIYVRDLLHGRNFVCASVVELARKEAWLETVSAYLRQVMESAKHWDGTTRVPVAPLPKDEARQVILRGL